MNQTKQLVAAIKRSLKIRGLTYRDVANYLDLSEASVKRLFSTGSFSLQRLEAICNLLDIDFYELVRMTSMATVKKPQRLTVAQEQALADSPSLFAYFYLLLNGWTHQGICKEHGLSEVASIRRLAALDRLRLIELLPGNRVRLLTDHIILWRRDGPVKRRYEKEIRQDFMNSAFTGDDESLHFEAVELSEYSIKVLQRKISALIRDISELTDLDTTLPPDERRWMGVVFGYRPWIFDPSVFKKNPR